MNSILDFIAPRLPSRIKDFLRPFLSQTLLDFLRGRPSQRRNIQYNRALWDSYAKHWDRKHIHIENPNVAQDQRALDLVHLGDEWGQKSDVDKIVEEYIKPYVTPDSIVLEIGVGGGRIASRVAGAVKELYCLDVSKEMLRRAQLALANYSNVRLILLHEPVLPDTLAAECDFIYSFDTFVHLDLHTMWKYFVQIHRALRQGGHAFIHTTNLKAPGGWGRFCSQKEFRVAGHYFISPEIVEILAQHSGLKIIKTSSPDPTNFYLNRDLLVVLHKTT